jgi:mono/diheme cytochrome c family protein
LQQSRAARDILPTPVAIAFIIFWILVALIVFFVAMRGGPRGARQALHTESRASRRAVAVLVLVLTVAGIAVPTLVLAFNGKDKAGAAPGGVKLNAAEQHGRQLFSPTCATCHTLAAAKAVGKVGPNLDVLMSGIPTQAGRRALVLDAITNGRARGMGQMPALLYQGRDAQAVASFVAAVAGH